MTVTSNIADFWILYVPLLLVSAWYVIAFWRFRQAYKRKRGVEIWWSRSRAWEVLSTPQEDRELEAQRRRISWLRWVVAAFFVATFVGYVIIGVSRQ